MKDGGWRMKMWVVVEAVAPHLSSFIIPPPFAVQMRLTIEFCTV
jgi:hypothetical protein